MSPTLKWTGPDLRRAAILAVLDSALLFAGKALGWPVATTLPLSFLIATNLVLAAEGQFPSLRGKGETSIRFRPYWQYLLLDVLIVFLRGAIWSLAGTIFGNTPGLLIPSTSILSVLLFTASFTFTAASLRGETSFPNRSNLAFLSIFIVAYMLVLRILYLGVLNIIPEEAYYWNYGQHLDWGYLDHPPMVAWLSRLGTALLGHHEFGVRFFALISWCAAAWFAYRLTLETFGKKAAVGVVVMLSTMPFFIGIGCLMMPDAPLTACWAGALYFLKRAMFNDKPNAWYAAGICLGLGLLSKYTMGLLVPSAFIFIIWDNKSRHWLTRPQPYLALAIAAILFAPVIYWNSQHEWISFAFQTTRRWGESIRFSPHLLLGSILVLLTPAGLWAAYLGLKKHFLRVRHADTSDKSQTRFVLSFVLVPLAVYTVFSLTHEPKLNWTGPLWLALLPIMGALLYSVDAREASSREARREPFDATISPKTQRLRRAWHLSAIILVSIYGAALYWVVIGIPGVPYPKSLTFVAGWNQLSEQISGVEAQVKSQTGQQPLLVGMNRYFISSELAFYDKNDGPSKCAGRHLFNDIALMYRFWFPEDQQIGKNIIVIADDRSQLETDAVISRFDSLTNVRILPIENNGRELSSYWYRVGWGYKK